MVRAPDFVYGIVDRQRKHEQPQYGFERQATADAATLARVRALVSRFQWRAHADGDSQAIALEAGQPNLVAAIGVGTGDPSGRTCVRMRIWVEPDDSAVERLVRQLWPDDPLPVSADEFIAAAGRVVAGPAGTFQATDFDSAWGLQSAAAASRRRTPLAASPPSAGESWALRGYAVLATMVCLALGWYCYLLFRDRAAIRREAVRVTELREQSDRAFALLNKQFESVTGQFDSAQFELRQTRQSLSEQRRAIADRDIQIADLKQVIAGDRQQTDQAELRRLRNERPDIERLREVMESLKHAVDQIDSSLRRLPDTP